MDNPRLKNLSKIPESHRWSILVDGQKVTVTTRQLLSPRQFWVQVVDQLGIGLDIPSRNEWDTLIRNLLENREG